MDRDTPIQNIPDVGFSKGSNSISVDPAMHSSPDSTVVTVALSSPSCAVEQARPVSPRVRVTRKSPSPVTTVDLLKDSLPELQLSDEDKRKNLELLEEARKASGRFLTRRGRRSTSGPPDSPQGLSPNQTPHSSPVPSRSSSLTLLPQIGTDVAAPERTSPVWPSETPQGGHVATPVSTHRAPCTAEIRTIEAFPPLMRAVSWVAGTEDEDEGVHDGRTQKLSRLREGHKLIRNQSIAGCKLPDLNEERAHTSTAEEEEEEEEESRERKDVLPNISDVMLRKLKLHRAQTGSAPPLTEKEVENAFVQLSLAFRNDSYTLDTRVRLAERDRDLAEKNTDRELEELRVLLKGTPTLWQHSEWCQRLVETLEVLHSLATRLSGRAEVVGAVRQERRMNKATEVMMHYVENLKRTYEKDHAELMEFKRLANQNSSRYGSSVDTEDGIPRTSRSMSLTLGKALPRRRVSVAVVPKFNLVGQNAVAAGPIHPVLCEAGGVKVEPLLQPASPLRRVRADGESEVCGTPDSPSMPEVKAKIEEDAFNKGYEEGLRHSKDLQQLEEEEEEMKTCVKKEELKERKSDRSCVETLDGFLPNGRRGLLWAVLSLLAATFITLAVFSYLGKRDTEPGNRRERFGGPV